MNTTRPCRFGHENGRTDQGPWHTVKGTRRTGGIFTRQGTRRSDHGRMAQYIMVGRCCDNCRQVTQSGNLVALHGYSLL